MTAKKWAAPLFVASLPMIVLPLSRSGERLETPEGSCCFASLRFSATADEDNSSCFDPSHPYHFCFLYWSFAALDVPRMSLLVFEILSVLFTCLLHVPNLLKQEIPECNQDNSSVFLLLVSAEIRYRVLLKSFTREFRAPL